MKSKSVHMLAFLLLWIGGLNWGLIGLLEYNLVDMVLGNQPALENLIYIFVGLAAIYTFVVHQKECKVCGKK